IKKNKLYRKHKKKICIKKKQIMTNQQREMVKNIRLNIDFKIKIKELTIAQQQLVEIVKAVSFNIKILVMDEPTSSLSDEEVNNLFITIEKLKQNNISIIYISHRFEELFQVTNQITVIRDGKYIGTKETNRAEERRV